MRLLSFAFAGLFAYAAYLNLNDPDPTNWILIYLAAAFACLRPTPLFSTTLVLSAGAWAYQIYGTLDLKVPVEVALTDWSMSGKGSEEVRELAGLLTICVVVSLLAISRRVSR